jgi:hypothetical protein
MQLPEQLDYFSAMLQEEQQLQHKAGMQQQQDHFKSAQVQSTSTAFQNEGLQDLEPCDAEWIPAAAADSSLLGPLEDGPLDSDASPLQRYANNAAISLSKSTQQRLKALHEACLSLGSKAAGGSL